MKKLIRIGYETILTKSIPDTSEIRNTIGVSKLLEIKE